MNSPDTDYNRWLIEKSTTARANPAPPQQKMINC